MKNLISICCLSYNHEKYIEFAIRSFWNQDYKNIEILALDDGSSDNSLEILYKLKEQSPVPMKVFSQSNSGKIGENFNKLKNESEGDYLVFISLDDALLKDALSKKIKIMDSDQNIKFVINSKIQGIDENNKYTKNIPPLELDKIHDPSIDDLLEIDFNKLGAYYIQGCVFRRTLIDAVGGFDDDMLGDDIVLRTKVANYMKCFPNFTFVTLHEPACLYRRHSSNISANGARQIKIVAQYLQRYFPDKPIPDTFFSWVVGQIRNLGINDYIEINEISNGILKKEENLYQLTKLLDQKHEREQKRARKYKRLFKITLIISFILFMMLIFQEIF